MDLLKYEDILSIYKIRKNLLQVKEKEMEKRLDNLSVSYNNLVEARDIMSAVGIISQKAVKVIIEELVSQALQGIFGDNYSFELEDKILRNKPETDFYVIKNGRRRSLKDDTGVGVVDVVSIALRVIFWAIENPRTDNVIIFDEPVRALHSRSMLESCGEMFKKLSEMLGLQFIIVSDVGELLNCADLIFHVEQIKGISTVEKISVNKN